MVIVMNKNKIYEICVWWLIMDQFLKIIISLNLKLNQQIIIIPKFLKLYYLKNDGAAFSSFSGMRYLLILISITIFFILIKYISKNQLKSNLEIISLGMIMGGLVGNLVDR